MKLKKKTTAQLILSTSDKKKSKNSTNWIVELIVAHDKMKPNQFIDNLELRDISKKDLDLS